MTKYIKYHKEYTKFGEAYQLVLPLNLEGLVPNESFLFMKKQKSKSEYESEVTAPPSFITIRRRGGSFGTALASSHIFS